MRNKLPVLLVIGRSPLMTLSGRKIEKREICVEYCETNDRDTVMGICRKLRPDVILMECVPSITHDYTIALTDELCTVLKFSTVVVTLSDHTSAGVKRFPDRRNLRLLMLPTSTERIADIIECIARRSRGGFIQPDIMVYLMDMGFSRKLGGFDILCLAVEMCVREPWRLMDIMDAVYGDAGKRAGIDGVAVERQLRFLCQDAYEKGVTAVLTRGMIREKLTNYELICAACDGFITHMKVQGLGRVTIKRLP